MLWGADGWGDGGGLRMAKCGVVCVCGEMVGRVVLDGVGCWCGVLVWGDCGLYVGINGWLDGGWAGADERVLMGGWMVDGRVTMGGWGVW